MTIKEANELKEKKIFEMECPIHYGIMKFKKDYPNKHYLPEMFPMKFCRCNEIKKMKAKEKLKELGCCIKCLGEGYTKPVYLNGDIEICECQEEKQMSECDREAMERSQRQWGDVCIFYSRKNCRYDK